MVYAVVFLCWCACAGLGAYVAGEKGRGAAEGLILGFLFGPLGVLVAALLPTAEAVPAVKRKRVPTRDPYAWREGREGEEEDRAPGYLGLVGAPKPATGPAVPPARLDGRRVAWACPRCALVRYNPATAVGVRSDPCPRCGSVALVPAPGEFASPDDQTQAFR